MKKTVMLLIIGAVIMLGTGIPVWASPWQISGGERIISKGQVISGDLIFSGSRLEIEGTIEGDLLVLAGEVRIDGRVGGSVLGVVSERLTINGTVARDVRVLALELLLNGAVDRNLTVWTYHLATGPQSRIGQGILGKMIELKLAGTVGGPVDVNSYNFNQIGGRIGGDVIVRGAPARWTSPLAIGGKVLDYSVAPSNPSHVKGVAVAGGYEVKVDQGNGLILMLFLGWLLGSLILSIVIFRLFPRTVWRITETSATFRKNLLIGMAGFIAIPVLIAIFSTGIVFPYLSLISLPFIILLILLYIGLLFFSGILVNIWFGRLLFRSKLHPVLMIVLGGLTLAILNTLPLINLGLVLVTNCVGFGMILRSFKFQFKDEPADFISK